MGKNKKLNSAEKRKKEFEQRRKGQYKIIASLVVIALIFSGVFYVLTSNNESKNKNVTREIVPSDDTIQIPLGDISNEADFYSYDSDGIEIEFFTIKRTDNQVHVALNACDLCYHAKKGYVQTEDVMQCINCGLTYPINGIGTTNTEGGCWPSYVPINIDGDNVVIEKSDLDSKKFMFE